MNVVYLPGLLGSDLAYARSKPFPPQNVWLDLVQLASGGAVYLQLDPDGSSPGPLAEGRPLIPASILAPVYSPLGVYLLTQGYNLLVVPFDWRQSVITSAAAVWRQVQSYFGSEPFVIVAHSMGGMVARAMAVQMHADHRDSQLIRLVCLCTPHFGSMESVRLLNRLPQLYNALVAATAWPPTLLSKAGPAYLDAVIASWPGIYELLPFLAAGPLPELVPDLAPLLWKEGYYAGGNPFLQQAALDSALVTQEYLVGSVPAGKLVCVVGVGQQTSYLPAGPGPGVKESDYVSTDQGDGTVALGYASLPGVPRLIVHGTHVGILLAPAVWAALPPILANGLAGDVVL